MYTTAEGDDKRKESRSFGNSHTLLVNGTISKIRIFHKHGAPFEMIAARIYSTQTVIEIPLLEESLIRLVFQNCNQTVAYHSCVSVKPDVRFGYIDVGDGYCSQFMLVKI